MTSLENQNPSPGGIQASKDPRPHAPEGEPPPPPWLPGDFYVPVCNALRLLTRLMPVLYERALGEPDFAPNPPARPFPPPE